MSNIERDIVVLNDFWWVESRGNLYKYFLLVKCCTNQTQILKIDLTLPELESQILCTREMAGSVIAPAHPAILKIVLVGHCISVVTA